MSLPMSADLSEADQNHVVQLLRQRCGGKRDRGSEQGA